MEQYFQFTGANYQMLIDQAKDQALKRIQSRLVLEAVVAAEGMTATEEEYEAEIKRMADAYQMEVDKIKEIIGKSEEEQIKADLCIAKAVELVVAEAVEGDETKKPAKKTTTKKTTKKTEESENE